MAAVCHVASFVHNDLGSAFVSLLFVVCVPRQCRQGFAVLPTPLFLTRAHGPLSLLQDKDGSGSVSIADIRGVFNAKKHPEVIERKKTEEQVLTEFLTVRALDSNVIGAVCV